MYFNATAQNHDLFRRVTIRTAGPDDADAIRRIAQVDTKLPPTGPTLVAEIGGSVVAAGAIEGGEVVADPFRPTRDAVDLLEFRAAQIRAAREQKGTGVAVLRLARQFIAARDGSTHGAARPQFAPDC
jgi:hypothetical protein